MGISAWFSALSIATVFKNFEAAHASDLGCWTWGFGLSVADSLRDLGGCSSSWLVLGHFLADRSC